MGLDIAVVTRWRAVDGPALVDDEAWEARHIWVEVLSDFPEQGKDLKSGYIERIESWGFRAGSYSGYTTWRDNLCWAANGYPVDELWLYPDEYPDALFWELLNYSDCAGALGPAACAECAKDMEAFFGSNAHRKYVSELEPDVAEMFEADLLNWKRAFEDTAASGGVIVFH